MWGSKLFEDYVPSEDATVVTRLKRAGGVFKAKTNLPEFALWGETDNSVFGRTVNFWNFDDRRRDGFGQGRHRPFVHRYSKHIRELE